MSYKNKVNVYRCNAGHLTVTVDKDEGTTPFIITCPKCGGGPDYSGGPNDNSAKSRFYNCYQFIRPEYEWYAPSAEEVEILSPGAKEHVNMGGLLKRKIDHPPICPKLKPSWTVLPDMLEKRNGEGKYDSLILIARSGGFDDYKFDRVIPEKWGWICPKSALVEILNSRYPELSDILSMVVAGDFDDKMDANDMEKNEERTTKIYVEINGAMKGKQFENLAKLIESGLTLGDRRTLVLAEKLCHGDTVTITAAVKAAMKGKNKIWLLSSAQTLSSMGREWRLARHMILAEADFANHYRLLSISRQMLWDEYERIEEGTEEKRLKFEEIRSNSRDIDRHLFGPILSWLI